MNKPNVLHFDRPPITEAVIELRFSSAISEEKMQGWVGKLRRKYPNALRTNSVTFQIANTAANVAAQATGYRLSSDDQTDIVIINPNSVAVARLAPYQGWDQFFACASRVFRLAEKKGQIPNVTRIGVRFINRIDIPCDEGGGTDTIQYVKLYAAAPEGIFLLAHQSVTQINADLTEPDWRGQVTSARVDSPLMDHISLMLDIDVYRETQIGTAASQIYKHIETARDLKNMIFKQCITPKAEALFKDV